MEGQRSRSRDVGTERRTHTRKHGLTLTHALCPADLLGGAHKRIIAVRREKPRQRSGPGFVTAPKIHGGASLPTSVPSHSGCKRYHLLLIRCRRGGAGRNLAHGATSPAIPSERVRICDACCSRAVSPQKQHRQESDESQGESREKHEHAKRAALGQTAARGESSRFGLFETSHYGRPRATAQCLCVAPVPNWSARRKSRKALCIRARLGDACSIHWWPWCLWAPASQGTRVTVVVE